MSTYEPHFLWKAGANDNFVLILESSKTLGRLLAERIWELTSYRSHVVSDPSTAFFYITQVRRPCLLLLDNNLGYEYSKHNLHGIDVCDRLRQFSNLLEMPIVMLVDDRTEARDAEKLGIPWYSKDNKFESDVLVELVKKEIAQVHSPLEGTKVA